MRNKMKSLITILFLILIAFPLKAQEEQNCMSAGCHDNYLKAENVHSVIADGCESCHEQNYDNHPKRKGNEFEFTEDLNTLCFDCHDEPDEKLMTHEPFVNGECISCHNPHSSDNFSLLKAEDVSELCANCHDVDNAENMVKHGPFISGQCNICHEPHQAATVQLLKAESPTLCFNCHVDKEELLSLPTIHVAYEGSCTVCHSPHDSKNKYLVKKAVPNLCLDCHDDMGREIKTAKTVHKIINKDES